ncbi:MAG: UvrD-helicase domain-containing protein [Verrucomicrobiota bacterium]|nr:UvrD-helicase domain-containing protein [Verrucomicrobiota bacterium]
MKYRLNSVQQKAVRVVDGPLLILAGAGTGKTSVITHRIEYMVKSGILPANILAVTFTNKAAREMKSRLHQMLGKKKGFELKIGTFHSLCAGILRKYIHLLGYHSDFSIADTEDQKGVLSQIITEEKLSRDEFDLNMVRNRISSAKSSLLTPDGILGNNISSETIAGIWRLYQKRMKDQNMVDFDDLLALTIELWKTNYDVLQKHREHFKYVMVDEYQDTNHIQFSLINMLSETNRNLCVVGDDDQSIYAWRGADVSNILNFQEKFPETKIIKLEQNYRSTKNILKAAHSVISNNPERYDKKVWSDHCDGDLIKCIKTENAEKEAEFLARFIREEKIQKQLRFDDFSILFRSNYQSRSLEKAMRQNSIPYRLIGLSSFFERKEVRDALAYLKILINPSDRVSFRRILNVPPRRIGSTTIQKLNSHIIQTEGSFLDAMINKKIVNSLPNNTKISIEEFTKQLKKYRGILYSNKQSCSRLAGDFLIDIGYTNNLGKIYKPRSEAEQRYENVCEFINDLTYFENNIVKPGQKAKKILRDYLEYCSLKDDKDKTEDDKDSEGGVALLTVHSAKGLEFPYVILAGMEQKLFPHEHSLKDGQGNEERRLFYVAVTRAKQNLALTYANTRKRYGKAELRRPSQYIDELPEDLVEKIKAEDAFKVASEEQVDDFFKRMKERMKN